MSPIKVGVVGLSSTGWAASALAPGLLNAPSFSLTAVSTTSAASAEASAQKYSALAGHPVKSFHGDASGIANDKDVDLVAVSVKAPAHRAVALAVIEAGKDVFIEWPAGANATETAEIAAAAKAKGVKSIVGLQGRQAPSVKKVKEILESGVIGKVRSSSIIALCPRELNVWGPTVTERNLYFTDINGGATLLDIGVGHLFDAVTHLLGDLATVSATTAQHYPIVTVLDDEQKPTGKTVNASAPDQIAFNGLFKSGAISSAIFCAGLPATQGRKHFLWEIDGEEGSIRMESDEFASLFVNVKDPKVYLNGELVEFEAVTGPATNLTSAWEAFAKGEAYPTLEDALKTRRLLEGIKQIDQLRPANTPQTCTPTKFPLMEHEAGDDYIRRIASFIRINERALGEAGIPLRRRGPPPKPASAPSSLNPMAWFGPERNSPPPKPIKFAIDTHHLFYLLMRMEDGGIDGVGTLDVKVDNPSKPMNYINIFRDSDKSDTLSMASFRSTLSAVSGLSLGAAWWGRPEPPSINAELKYLFSCFTKIPALVLSSPGPKMVKELANEPPNENCLPLEAFRSLQVFECADIDPRTVLGWDRLSDGLRSLTIKRSGLEDVSDIFIGAVLDDHGRREGTTSRSRSRRVSPGHAQQSSVYSTRLPETVPEANEDSAPPTPHPDPDPIPHSDEPAAHPLPDHKWSALRYLSLSDNSLTFLPTDPLAYLSSVSSLDLSSNLLVSVPPGLSALHSLSSLNLSDNMIDSVLGIYTHLGQILSLNLARNRLESICGLERLLALERVDLRHNIIDDPAEVSRLAVLPNISDVWIEGNPFCELDDAYRVMCFEYFWKEGKSIALDGSAPGLIEKRGLSVRPDEQMSSSRGSVRMKANSPPVVAVGGARSPALNASPDSSQPGSRNDSPLLAAVGAKEKERKKKNKRIVDLSGPGHRAVRSEAEGSAAEGAAVAGPGPRPAVHRARPSHGRHRSEFSSPPPSGLSPPSPSSPLAPGEPLSRSAARRNRVSASVFEPPTAGPVMSSEANAEAYRRRIEALQNDMGEGWLKVFSQGQMGSPGVSPGVASG
ncbi:hypothetical protein FIBSPDRAFT_898884 [Athelia psychrophila]|uniref:Uncharacterized protein n=1 Tax=Athelia psychrophila TaxID=1759441 RepID=A0A166AIA9_9AGAM|nr:hypothetical protein FIBSPDRAFT_898884 [Fibularhizoctonia sp. CBS 109695]